VILNYTLSSLTTSTTTTSNSNNDKGIIPRSIEYIFNKINNNDNNNDTTYDIRLSIMEIYQEKLIDLLTAKDTNNKNNNNNTNTILRIREHVNTYGIRQGVYVDGLIEKIITKENEFHDLLLSSLNVEVLVVIILMLILVVVI
jgi:hypothetical protein